MAGGVTGKPDRAERGIPVRLSLKPHDYLSSNPRERTPRTNGADTDSAVNKNCPTSSGRRYWLPGMDSNHELDRILKVHKLLILQGRRSHQKHQNQVFGTKSVQIFCREFGSRLLPLDSPVNLQRWAGSNTVLSICSQPVYQASARLADSIHWNDRCRAALAGMPVRVGRTDWPLTMIGHGCIIHI